MSDAMRSALKAYASIDPRDMRDAEFFCSAATAEELLKAAPYADPDRPGFGGQLLGRPIRIDESVPFGTVIAIAETEYDRMIRRAARDHLPIVVRNVEPLFMPAPLPAPDPTLRALLRHWWRKARKILKKLVDFSASSR